MCRNENFAMLNLENQVEIAQGVTMLRGQIVKMLNYGSTTGGAAPIGLQKSSGGPCTPSNSKRIGLVSDGCTDIENSATHRCARVTIFPGSSVTAWFPLAELRPFE